MATGDLKNNIRRLQSKLKICNYPKDIDIKGISKGLPQEYLPLMHYILLDFSRPFAQHIVDNDVELYGKSDEKFMIAVYKVFRDIFHYKPSITRQQFFSRGFAEHKIILVVDLIRMVKEKHKELSKAPSSGRLKKAAGSLGRLQSTPSKEQVSSVKTAMDPHQLASPDILTASTNEATSTVFQLSHTSEPTEMKTTEMDIGYHTAETSPTIKTEGEDAKQASVSVNELRAKFETSSLHKQESFDSKLSDTDLEEHPVIQALVKQIVHLEEQLTASTEEIKALKAETEERHCNMQARMVLMQNSITLLESKVFPSSEPEKPVRAPLAQGASQDVPLAFLRPNQRRPENVPLPESPIVPPTPSQTPSSAQTPPPSLSISAVLQDHESPPAADVAADRYKSGDDDDDDDQPVRDVSSQRYQTSNGLSDGEVRANKPPVSVVGPLQSYIVPTADAGDPPILTVLGVSSPTPMDTAWVCPSSSTPIEASSSVDDGRHHSASSEDGRRGPASNDDDIDEGLVDVDDGDLGEYIQEAARDISPEIMSADSQERVRTETEESDQDAGEGENLATIPNQLQRLQDMLVNTRQMLAMDSSLTPEPPKEE